MPASSETVAPGLALLRAVPVVSPAAPQARAAMVGSSASPDFFLPQPRRVVHQGEVPCCVSCALGAAMEILNPSWPPIAPLFHYYVTRFDNRGADAGGFLILTEALATLENQGICSSKAHPFPGRPLPFTSADASSPPSSTAYEDGLLRRLTRLLPHIPSYEPVSPPSLAGDLREQLRNGHPAVLGFRLPAGYPGFISNLKNHEWSDPDVAPSETGHCVAVVGYSDARQSFRIQDSRGEKFAEYGCWWMGYRVVDSSFTQAAYYFK